MKIIDLSMEIFPHGCFRRTNGPDISETVAAWFGEQQIAAFCVETRTPGVRKLSNRGVHRICGEMGYTHYENLINPRHRAAELM